MGFGGAVVGPSALSLHLAEALTRKGSGWEPGSPGHFAGQILPKLDVFTCSFKASERLVFPRAHPNPLGWFLASCMNQVLAAVPGEICMGKQDASRLQAPLMALFSHWGYGK